MPTASIIRERPAEFIPETSFHAKGNCLWVRFEDDEYVQWCGVFGAGNMWYEGKVFELPHSDFGILASGRLYRVNANSRKLRFASEVSELTDVLYYPPTDLLLGADNTRLYAFDARGESWRSERVSFDGIALTDISDDRLNGFVGDISNASQPFILFLDGMHFESDVDREWFDD